MTADETVVKVADAIRRSRNEIVGNGYPRHRAGQVAVVDHVATSIAEELFPHDALTQNCSRRLFLTAAGVDVKRLLAPREASQTLADQITHACGPKTGCSADSTFPPG